MSYYIVHKANPYFKSGTVIELFDDGFQECIMETKGNRMTCVGNRGLVIPEKDVFPFCMLMLRKGFDDPKLRRKSGKGTIDTYDSLNYFN